MPTLRDTEILDLVTATISEMGAPKWEQIAQDLQDYEVMSKWLKEDKITEEGGVGITRNLMLKYSNVAKHTGLFEEDTVDVTDVMAQMRVDWKRITAYYAFERREVLQNKGKYLVNNVLEPRRANMMIALAEELEDKAWTAPDATSETDPWGLLYWVVKNATAGFNGGLPTGFTTVAGINITTYPNFKNYSGTYTVISEDDFIAKLSTAHRKTKWVSPVTVEQFRSARGERRICYANDSLVGHFEKHARSQNDNLGSEIAVFDGVTTFRRHPIRYIPKLDEDTTDPFYMIDHSTFSPVVLNGDYLRESDVRISGKSHNVMEAYIDMSYNYLCVNRRKNVVFYKV